MMSEKQNFALRLEIEEANNQREKLKERNLVLENEHREVAQHVHNYYKEISGLERKLQTEIIRNKGLIKERDDAIEKHDKFIKTTHFDKMKALE